MANLFLVLFVVSYLLLWGHFVYALILGPFYQYISYRRRNARLAREALRARASPGGPNPLASQLEGPDRMTMRTAIICWALCAQAVLALGILPYMVLFADIGSVTPNPAKRDTNWWDLVEEFYGLYVLKSLESVGLVGNIVLFIAINREIVIMAGLALFVRWPVLDPALSLRRYNTARRKSAYSEGAGTQADDTLTATLERHRSIKRAASQKSKQTIDENLVNEDDEQGGIVLKKLKTSAPRKIDDRKSPIGHSETTTVLKLKSNLKRPRVSQAAAEVKVKDRDEDQDESLDVMKQKLTKLILDSTKLWADPVKLDPFEFVISPRTTEEPAGRPSFESVSEGPRLRRGFSTPNLKDLARMSTESTRKPLPGQANAPVPPVPAVKEPAVPPIVGRETKSATSETPPARPPTIHRSTSLGNLTSWATAAPSHSVPFKGLRHAIIIACHNSSEVLIGTLTRLLQLVEPKAVFLADNGSSDAEVEATKRVAEQITASYRLKHPDYSGPGINVGVLKQGSKTIAQFSVLNSLAYLRSDIEFVSLLDDDTVFPDDWSEQYTLNMFDEMSDCHCLAYPLGAERNAEMSLLEHFQDFEYRISMFTKIAQATISSSLFPSGAVSTWRAITLLDILSRHDTMFRGDDLQMGLLMHTLYHEIKFLNPEEVHLGNYAIRCAPFTIPTRVPVHWFHWKDLFPKVYWRKLPDCDCGEPSLFYQRARSWEVARHRFFGKFVRVCTHSQKLHHKNTWFAKICALDSVIGILNDFVQIGMVAFVFALSRRGIAIGILSLTSLAFQLVAFDLLNIFVIDGHPKTVVPCEIRVLYPLCYTPTLNVIVKHAAMIYNYLHYTPFVRNNAVIGAQARKEILDTMWTSWSPYAIVQEQWEVLKDVAQRIRNIEKSKRFRPLRSVSSFTSARSAASSSNMSTRTPWVTAEVAGQSSAALLAN